MTEPSAGLEQEETEHDVDLIHECVVKMAKEISDFMDITPDKQRMDSLMVAANIRNLIREECLPIIHHSRVRMFALNNYAGVSRKQPESTFAGVLQLDA